MDSGHQLNRVSSPTPSKFAELIGTVIAVLTLTLPVLVVASYSGAPRDAATIAPPLSKSAIIVRQMNRDTNGR